MGSINSYAQYRSYFGFSLTEGTPATGIVYAVFTIGNLVGAGGAGPAADVGLGKGGGFSFVWGLEALMRMLLIVVGF